MHAHRLNLIIDTTRPACCPLCGNTLNSAAIVIHRGWLVCEICPGSLVDERREWSRISHANPLHRFIIIHRGIRVWVPDPEKGVEGPIWADRLFHSTEWAERLP